ncbi:MAG TPA: hypothetical protein VN776_14200 [Terracidiphilus sp.]|nr:hypothetical protein [Terracidiphilus sp.]
MDSRKLCAYNQTRECFLGLEVEGADLPLAKLKDRIASLALKSGEGLWLVPFRGLPEWGIRVPLDLLYLDQDCRVIDVVESYPVFRANASTPQPASVLALPTHSIYSSQTQFGDQLVLCVADEMQQRLERFTGISAVPGAAVAPRPIPVPSPLKRPAPVPAPTLVEDAPKRAPATVVQSAVLLREKPLWSGGPGLLELEKRNEPELPPTRQTHLMGLIQPDMENVKPPRGWLERWWSPDPRKAPRDAAPGLAAYYWTGGPPEAHEIRDISSTGLYVVTEERWYPGTLILVTLQNTAFGPEVAERTICVHSRAVRWGKDGVGLQFVLQKSDDPTMGAADRKALDKFLQRLRKSQG